jgi:NADH dehydrogenase FAD-containing subunit
VIELLSPERTCVRRELALTAAFGGVPGPGVPIEQAVGAAEANVVYDRCVRVDPFGKRLWTADGAERAYDALVIAAGATLVERFPGAISFGVPGSIRSFRTLLAAAERGHARRLIFSVPEGDGWPLAIYELALRTARRLRALRTDITLMTHEEQPLEMFAGHTSDGLLDALEREGVRIVTGLSVEAGTGGELRSRPGRIPIHADAVITMPALLGPSIAGLPCDIRGFLVTERDGRIRGLRDVYAVGDAVASPLKHGGIAAQQVAATVEAIASELGREGRGVGLVVPRVAVSIA